MTTPQNTADTTAPTIENYRQLLAAGAGPAAYAMFAQLPADAQATIREENLRARGIIDHGSRFD